MGRKKKRRPEDGETCQYVTIAPGVRFRASGAPLRGRRQTLGPDGAVIIPVTVIDMAVRRRAPSPLPRCPYTGEM